MKLEGSCRSVNNIGNSYRFACLNNTVINYTGFETSILYCSVPMWTCKLEIIFLLLHMGMSKMDYLLCTDSMWTLTRLRHFIYKLLTRENKESSCSHALAWFVLVISINFICVVRESSVILLDIKIRLPYTHPGKANSHVTCSWVLVMREAGKMVIHPDN